MLERAKLVILFFSTIIVGYGLVGGLMERVSAGDETYRDLSVFTNVFNKVKNDYVEEPDMQKAMAGALQGMIESLDPFSSFVDSDTYDALSSRDLSAGVGLVVSKRYGYGYVVGVDEDSPAHDSGLRVGDLIESIDGHPTALMGMWEAQRRLAGPENSEVALRVLRSRRTEPQDMVLKRSAPAPVTPAARVLDDRLGYLRIPSFQAGSAESVEAKLRMLLSSDVNGILLDVRGAASGEISEAVRVSELFLPVGLPILTVKGRAGASEEYVSLKPPLVRDLPIVLLIDGGTSGAAEVFAASLVDNALAHTVGERTNGYGSVQEKFSLDSGAVLLISTKLHYRPNGQLFQSEELRKSGVEPNTISPSRDFVTNFYFENAPETEDGDLGESFYRRLDEAVGSEQLDRGVAELRARVEHLKARKAA